MSARLAAILIACAALIGCSQAPTEGPVVFAAASLSEVLPTVAPEATLTFDGSSGLLDQLRAGARADVFASADKRNMDFAVDEGLIDGDPVAFATNVLVLVVPTGNPAAVTGLDSSLGGVKLVVCAPEVPCGGVTAKVAEAAGATLKPVSEESKVSDVLGKVASGEADAGFVYRTDAMSSSEVEAIEIPGSENFATTYWAGVVTAAPQPDAARAFIASLTGEWSDELAAAGFGPA